MGKKSAIVIIIIIIVAVGGYLIYHKDHKKITTTTSYTVTKSSNTTNPSNNSSSTPAVNNTIVLTKTSSATGSYLTDLNGNTLYTYSSDSSGVSNCSGSCLATWPAYIDKGSTSGLPANFGTITRKDNGDIQYTYKGLPLYYFANDSKGQVTGNGLSGFYVAKP